jgi:polyphosphate kinase
MVNTINRELSWLSFNNRVLQEAMDPNVPLIERVRFLGIYSNNMDEFYRVRVANVRRMMVLKKQKIQGFAGSAEDLYKTIREVVLQQQVKFEETFAQLVDELGQNNIHLINEKQVEKSHVQQLSDFFHSELKHEIFPIILDKRRDFPKLRDYAIYLAVKMICSQGKVRYALIQIPGDLSRFVVLTKGEKSYIILIDDIIRTHLKEIFSIFEPREISAYTFKFTRDAELDIDDDLSTNFIQKIEHSLKERKKGIPVRFVYDSHMPEDLLGFLLKSLNLKKGVNTIPGGRYHNFKDFISFPKFNNPDFLYAPQAPVTHPDLETPNGMIHTILKKDVLLHFPYQRFDYVIDLLREAALDPKVKSVKINIYRIARNSDIMNAILSAAFNGKEVVVVMELQARFDEENNLYWANRLKEFGVKVIFGVPNLKVHSKLLQITRVNRTKEQLITYIGTGNFNEKTSRIYTDVCLLTSNNQVSQEVHKVFKLMENNLERPTFRTLLVSPFNTRRKILALIQREIEHAKKGKRAGMRIKLNNLTDIEIIEKLYQASKAGVKIEMIIRGICCLIPGQKGLSENITVISIVDRYLEHGRFMIFENDGNPVYYITSADFMERNLDNRIEVGVQVLDVFVQQQLELLFDYQWRGSVKARLISADFMNSYHKRDLPPFHAQQEIYQHFKWLSEGFEN